MSIWPRESRLGSMPMSMMSMPTRAHPTRRLPGGLADPSEDFAETVAREVREETAVVSSLVGVVSLRHSHKFRFGQGDLYVVVRLLASSEAITIDPHELLAAEWMSPQVLHSID